MKKTLFLLLCLSHYLCLFLPTLAFANAAGEDFLRDLENFQESSLSLKTHSERMKAAEKELLSRSLFWTPDVSLSAGKSYSKINDQGTYDYKYARGSAQWNLFRGGFDLLKKDEAKALFKAQELARLNRSLTLEREAANLIFKAIYLRENLRIQEEILRMKEDSLKIVKGRFDQGKTPLQEVVKTEVDLNQLKNQIRTAQTAIMENDLEIQSSFIETLQTKSWPLSSDLRFSFQKNDPGIYPRVEQKLRILEAKELSWKGAKSQHLPQIDFGLNYQVTPLPGKDDRQWSSLIELKFPIWSKYETETGIANSQVAYYEAREDYQSEEKLVSLTRSFLIQKLEFSRKNLEEARGNLERVRSLYQDFLKSFRLGRLSTNDLLIEQNRVLENERSLAESQLTYHQTAVEACVLMGLPVRICRLK